MIYLTGDTHGAFLRFNTSVFPEQKQMTKEDYVIVCGDFGGIWDQHSTAEERYWLDWLENKPFSLLFIDGNHENFNRLNSDEFEHVEFGGSHAQRIRPGIYRLLRGQIYNLQGKRFFTFGGASSHDIEDGILDPSDFDSKEAFIKEQRRWQKLNRSFRIKNISWWPEELPKDSEMQDGIRALENVGYTVDYVITHCLPHDIASILSGCRFYPDRLTLYFNDLLHRGLQFEQWYCGHYHTNRRIMDRYCILYDRIERLL